jgi:hypothetical protein
MPDFGNDGTRIAHEDAGGATLRLGQHLHIVINAFGPIPIFSILCPHGLLVNQDSYHDHPKASYIFQWPNATMKRHSNMEDLDFSFSFARSNYYQLLVTVQNSVGSTSGLIKNIEYRSDDNGDTFDEFLTVQFV